MCSGRSSGWAGRLRTGRQSRTRVTLAEVPRARKPEKWRLPDEGDTLHHQERHPNSDAAWRRNFSSLNELTDKVLDVLHDQARRGEVTIPGCSGAVGAVLKEKLGGVLPARVLFDGTNGLTSNQRPGTGADCSRVRESQAGRTNVCPDADVSEAHRQVLVHSCDWYSLRCQVQSASDVLMEAVEDIRSDIGLLLLVSSCSRVGTISLSWSRTAGGDTIVWVGFELLHRSHQLGLPQRRTEWFISWTAELASSRIVHMASFKEGLGRITCTGVRTAFVRAALQVSGIPSKNCGSTNPATCLFYSRLFVVTNLTLSALQLRHGSAALPDDVGSQLSATRRVVPSGGR